MNPSPLAQLCKPRWATPRNFDRPTYGPIVARIGGHLGLPYMPWQHEVMDTACEVDPETGLFVYREVRLILPRQNGKTGLVLPKMVHRMIGFGERQSIVYTAQTRNAARGKWKKEHVYRLDHSPFFGDYKVTRDKGGEGIEWENDSTYKIDAPTETAGHGDTLDEGVIDEAFAHSDNRVEQAMKPAMATRANAQLWILSAAGTKESTYLIPKVTDGRARVEAGQDRGIMYVEYSAPEDADPEDPAIWWGCMPALGRTISEETVRADQQSMDADEFARAYLAIFSGTKIKSTIIPTEDWAEALKPKSKIVGRPTFSLDLNPTLTASAIGVAGANAKGRTHIEVVQFEPGTHWVVESLIERCRKAGTRRHVALDPKGPAGAMITALQKADFAIINCGPADMSQACGNLLVSASRHEVARLPDDDLDAAMAGAVKRKIGDTWAFNREASLSDISPLVAVTVAHWAHLDDPESTTDVLDTVA